MKKSSQIVEPVAETEPVAEQKRLKLITASEDIPEFFLEKEKQLPTESTPEPVARARACS